MLYKTQYIYIYREREKKAQQIENVYKKLNIKRACKIIREPNSIAHKVTFQSNLLDKWTHSNRRVGQPRMSWAKTAVNEIWNLIKEQLSEFRYAALDNTKIHHTETMK